MPLSEFMAEKNGYRVLIRPSGGEWQLWVTDARDGVARLVVDRQSLEAVWGEAARLGGEVRGRPFPFSANSPFQGESAIMRQLGVDVRMKVAVNYRLVQEAEGDLLLALGLCPDWLLPKGLAPWSF